MNVPSSRSHEHGGSRLRTKNQFRILFIGLVTLVCFQNCNHGFSSSSGSRILASVENATPSISENDQGSETVLNREGEARNPSVQPPVAPTPQPNAETSTLFFYSTGTSISPPRQLDCDDTDPYGRSICDFGTIINGSGFVGTDGTTNFFEIYPYEPSSPKITFFIGCRADANQDQCQAAFEDLYTRYFCQTNELGDWVARMLSGYNVLENQISLAKDRGEFIIFQAGSPIAVELKTFNTSTCPTKYPGLFIPLPPEAPLPPIEEFPSENDPQTVPGERSTITNLPPIPQ